MREYGTQFRQGGIMSDLVHMLFDSLDKSETEERDVNIPYKPKWTPIVGGVLPNILLQQMRYWWVKQGKKPYFKFNDKCEHVAYRPGDSWIEELGFSRSEFETARSKIATRITSGMSKSEHLEYKTSDGDLQPVNRIVIYWRDKSGQMWYRINEMLWWAYRLKADNPHLGNAEILHYLEMQESRITYQMQESRITFSTETTTETTTESSSGRTSPIAETATTASAAADSNLSKVITAYEQNIGVISPMISDELKDALEEYSADLIIDAFKEAVNSNVRKWKYCLVILRRWKVEGKTDNRKPATPTGITHISPPAPPHKLVPVDFEPPAKPVPLSPEEIERNSRMVAEARRRMLEGDKAS